MAIKHRKTTKKTPVRRAAAENDDTTVGTEIENTTEETVEEEDTVIEKLTAENFDPNDEGISELPALYNRADINNVPEGELFLAKFLHDPASDDMWAVRQSLPSLITGQVLRNEQRPEFWSTYASKRSPVAKRVGNGYVVLG